MNRLKKSSLGAKALSLLLAAGLALSVPMAAFAQDAEPVAPGENPSIVAPQPDPRKGFEEQLDTRERVRLALENTPQTYAARDTSEKEIQCQQLVQACRDAFAENKTEVSLRAYNLLTTDEIQAMLDTLRCLPGGEKLDALNFDVEEVDGQEVANYFEIQYLSAEEQQQMEAAIDYFCSFADKGSTPLQKALLVHDALALNAEYAMVAYELENNKLAKAPRVVYEPYGILVDRKGVCQSYAYAFQIILNRLGIPAAFVSSDKVNHAWNAVQLDGKWYHVDVTWDEGAAPDVPGKAAHDNFLKSTAVFESTHLPDAPAGSNDFIGLDNLTNVAAAATETTYDTFWWDSVESGIYPIGSSWYYLQDGFICRRGDDDFLTDDNDAVTRFTDAGTFTQAALLDDTLYCTDGTTITPYRFAEDEDGNWVATPGESLNLPNYGIACLNGEIYYAETQYPAQPNPDYTDYVRTLKTLDGRPLPLPPEPGVLVDAESFPDEAFRKYVLTYLETDRNGYLSRSERETVDELILNGKGIQDLTGLALFPNLEALNCSENGLTTLEVSGNPKLRSLLCRANALTELDASANPELDTLDCTENALTELDVTANAKLTQLACADNQLTALALGGNPKLCFLTCDNNHLAALDLSNNTALAADSTVEINDQILEREAVLEGENWVVSLTDLPGFDAAKVVVEPEADGYPRYENGKVILGRKGVAPRDSFGYFYATDSAIDKFYWMGVTVGVTPVYPAAPEPTAAAPAASAAPAPAPADNTHYIVCEACGYHDWVPYLEGYQCTHCGHLRGTTGVAATAAPAGTAAAKTTAKAAGGIPNTGDAANPAAVVVVLLLSGFGVGCGVYKKKKTEQ